MTLVEVMYEITKHQKAIMTLVEGLEQEIIKLNKEKTPPELGDKVTKKLQEKGG